MTVLVGVAGLILILIVLTDGFETIISPRRVRRPVRLARVFYLGTWKPWRALISRLAEGGARETLLSYYGPSSLLILLAFWAGGLVIGFAALYWAFGSEMRMAFGSPSWWVDVYVSATTFSTLGLGDVAPASNVVRMLMVAESGIGFAFLALIVSYLPALNTAFADREVEVSMLDEHAGSPPTAVELLRRYCGDKGTASVDNFLHDWERWSAELMESHLSYPVLGYFRSQHENQSWVAALTMVLDVCALVLVGIDSLPMGAARLTFAMARHASADLSQVYDTPPKPPEEDRLPPAELARLRALLVASGITLRDGPAANRQLAELRQMYEPYVNALAQHLLVTLPTWMPDPSRRDNWQVTGWDLDASPPAPT